MKKWILILMITAALLAGFLVGRGCSGRAPTGLDTHDHNAERVAAEDQVWTCSMHPQIRQPKPGKCPLCGMDLILAASSSAEEVAPRQLTLTPAASRLAEIETAQVERRVVSVEIRMTGKVDFDETRLAYVTARVPGRIDRLYANYVGTPVKSGEHLADLYSPSLVSAQQELLLAMKAGNLPGNAARLDAIRERLRLWGLPREQIEAIERNGQVHDHLTFYSPIGGIVVEMEAREGLYAETGTRLFTLADMTRLWVRLNAYESDLAWLRYAQKVSFQAEAYPGQTFTGTIAFIAPLLDPVTRTVSVRVNVQNADGRLKPGMFIRATVSAEVSGDGTAVSSDLRGKWISPMHPEIVKDAPGFCDVCGMPLVRAEDLGYANPERAASLPLVIPVSAPLLTGKRAVVYVSVPGQESVYEGRDITLGPRAGDFFLVRDGLREGERVVANGAFKIDSSLQIQGKPSMMSPSPDKPSAPSSGEAASPHAVLSTTPIPQPFRQQLDRLLDQALTVSAALAKDDLAGARSTASGTVQALAAVDMALLEGDAHRRWMEAHKALAPALEALTAAHDISPLRAAFAALAPELARLARTFGPPHAKALYEIRCPMAFENRGATWLQADDTVRNPYFGASMLGCGEVVSTISPAKAPSAQGGPVHE